LATSGTKYTVRWNDSYQGDGTKTGDISVTAYWYSDNINIFTTTDSGYTNGISFTASKTGYVMLRVNRYGSGGNGSYAIVYGDMDANPLPLIGTSISARQWTPNTISAASQYYYFLATSGTKYTVRWNDIEQGDGTKTGDIVVSAYWYSDSINIFPTTDSGYTAGQGFTASKTGYVILRVNRYGSGSNGSYALFYE
ncbi:MAG: hypothetical protein LBQ57_01965, partial [Spirochaetales bacterium]|nr:hypothetical protein [Spirochaetales bacterium]